MLYSVEPLHIPDGFLSIAVSLIFWALTAGAVGLALSKVGKDLQERQIPLMGVMAAFIFAAQMINFPVAGGTSGHLLGGTLAAVTLGPWAGILTMTSVVIVQGLLFQDGGLLVMGANIFNMGVLTVVIGYGLYRSVIHRPRDLRLWVIGLAAWLSVMAAALLTSLQLWLSGTARIDLVIPAMLGVHALIGVGEALITVAALAFILRTRPDLVETQAASPKGGPAWVAAGMLLSLGVVLLAPVASADPDGLERVAINMGFIDRGASAPFQVLPDYVVPFLGENALSTILAGLVGALVVSGAAVLVARLLRAQTARSSQK